MALTRSHRRLPTNAYLAAVNALNPSASNPFATTNDVTTALGSISSSINRDLFGGFVSGQYYDSGLGATLYTTKAFVAKEFMATVLIVPEDVTIDEFRINVTAFAAASNLKICIFDSSSNGHLRNLVYSTNDVPTTSNGLKTIAASFTFLKNTIYWWGIITDSAITVSALPLGSCYNLGCSTSVGQVYTSVRNIQATYAAPANLAAIGAFSGIRVHFVPPALNFKAA